VSSVPYPNPKPTLRAQDMYAEVPVPASLEGSKSFDFLRRDLRRAGSLDGGGGYDRSVYGGGAYDRSVYGGAYDRSVHAGGGGLGPSPSPGSGYSGGAGGLCIIASAKRCAGPA